MRRVTIATLIILTSTGVLASRDPAAQFVGTWQSRLSSVTRKHTITLRIAVADGKLAGTVILVNPDTSEVEMQILNPRATRNRLEFQQVSWVFFIGDYGLGKIPQRDCCMAVSEKC